MFHVISPSLDILSLICPSLSTIIAPKRGKKREKKKETSLLDTSSHTNNNHKMLICYD